MEHGSSGSSKQLGEKRKDMRKERERARSVERAQRSVLVLGEKKNHTELSLV